MSFRIIKILIVSGVSLYFGVVVLNNLTDYDSNFTLVQHVLTMDTVYPNCPLLWRSIHSHWVHSIFYGLIIFWEASVATLTGIGSIRLVKTLNQRESQFNQSKKTAAIGLALGFMLALLVFLSIGSEWFLMWQSTQWNGVTAGTRLLGLCGVSLLILLQPD